MCLKVDDGELKPHLHSIYHKYDMRTHIYTYRSILPYYKLFNKAALRFGSKPQL